MKDNFIWQDRKRHFGLPLSFTRYSMSTEALYEDIGFLRSQSEMVDLYRIEDIQVTVTLLQRLFRVGTVTVFSEDHTAPMLDMVNIKRPHSLRDLIHREAMEEKARVWEMKYGGRYEEQEERKPAYDDPLDF